MTTAHTAEYMRAPGPLPYCSCIHLGDGWRITTYCLYHDPNWAPLSRRDNPTTEDDGPPECPECGEALNDNYMDEHRWLWHGGPGPAHIDGDER